MAGYTEWNFRPIPPLTPSVPLMNLDGEVESTMKFIIYADDIIDSFRVQSCLVKSEKQAKEKSK